ncbi:hypothetical protein [Streptomyces sp. NPDC014006]
MDREISRTTLFGDPVDGDYREGWIRPCGKPLRRPEPFAFDLDTADFL